MSLDQAKAIAHRRWDLANEHSLDGYDEVLAEDFVHHGPGYDFNGRQAYKDHLADFFHGYPEARVAIEETTGNEKWMATICTLTARQENPVPWAPNPTGEPMVARLVTVHAMADGKIAEEWIVQEWGADRTAAPDRGAKRNGDCGMSRQVSKIVIERYGELWNSGNLAIVDELMTDDFVLCNPEGSETAGRAAFKAGVAHHHDTMTGFRVSIDHVVAEGDMVAIRFTAHGDHTGPFLGSTPAGKPLTWTGMQLLRFRDGRISSIWHQPDDLSLLRQLGRVQETALAGG